MSVEAKRLRLDTLIAASCFSPEGLRSLVGVTGTFAVDKVIDVETGKMSTTTTVSNVKAPKDKVVEVEAGHRIKLQGNGDIFAVDRVIDMDTGEVSTGVGYRVNSRDKGKDK